MREGPWQPPATITEDDVVGARRYLQAFDAEDHPAQLGVIEKWLVSVCGGLNHAMDEGGLRLRMAALASAVDDRPTFCFTGETRRAAQRRFEHVPTAKELIDFFDGVEAEERRDVKRLFALIDIGPRRPGAKRDDRAGPRQRSDFRWSVDEAEKHAEHLREKQDRERRELAEILRRRDAAAGMAEAPLVPARAFGESDLLYVARLAQHARERIDVGERSMRRDQAAAKRAEMDAARGVLTGEPPVKRPPPAGPEGAP